MGGAKSVPAHDVFLPFSRMDCRPAKDYGQLPAKLAEKRKRHFNAAGFSHFLRDRLLVLEHLAKNCQRSGISTWQEHPACWIFAASAAQRQV